ncbi:M20 family metallopeptidase [Kocuria sp. cx-455]|uniref:M20 family metallopeptidase n=1 Tax=Kocuria sp. cx-455 TaxID=2771377 RepID=UPI003D73636D
MTKTTTTASSALKQRIVEHLDERREQLLDFSHRLHRNPELGWEEVKASGWLAEESASGRGARVQQGLGALPTAVRAEAGTGELVVTVCAEYDALPGVGHACGHNVIAAAGLGAFLALAEIAEEIGVTVRLLGTPAEENGGGKIVMLEQGEFEGTHLAMMVHPMNQERSNMLPMACAGYTAAYTGRSAHASAMPWDGINALDAMVIANTAIGLARQQLEPDQQVHAMLTGAGDAPNVIPGNSSGMFMTRAHTLASLERVDETLRRCLEAGALATGCSLDLQQVGRSYSHMESDTGLEALWTENLRSRGREPLPADTRGGSTDMANVSLRFPTIHPTIQICADVPVHNEAFAAHAGGPDGDRAVLDGAYGLAATAVDAATTPAVRARLLAGQRRLRRDLPA